MVYRMSRTLIDRVKILETKIKDPLAILHIEGLLVSIIYLVHIVTKLEGVVLLL